MAAFAFPHLHRVFAVAAQTVLVVRRRILHLGDIEMALGALETTVGGVREKHVVGLVLVHEPGDLNASLDVIFDELVDFLAIGRGIAGFFAMAFGTGLGRGQAGKSAVRTQMMALLTVNAKLCVDSVTKTNGLCFFTK